MSGDVPEFCDTNVLVYAHDRTAGIKHQVARGLIETLCDADRLRISPQVLAEFFVTVTRKLPHLMDADEAAAAVAELSPWSLCQTSADDVNEAIMLARRYQLSFWHGLILVSADRSGANVVWSEDLQHGARYGSLHVRSPFIPTS